MVPAHRVPEVLQPPHLRRVVHGLIVRQLAVDFSSVPDYATGSVSLNLRGAGLVTVACKTFQRIFDVLLRHVGLKAAVSAKHLLLGLFRASCDTLG